MVTLWETCHEDSFIDDSIINYDRFSPKFCEFLDPAAVNLKPRFTWNTEEKRHEITTKLLKSDRMTA